MKTYSIVTDAFMDEVKATSLDKAIAEAFDGEIAGVTNRTTLEKRFAKYAADGGWCRIEEDGVTVLEIGSSR